VNLPEDLIALLHQPSLCYVATLMPDGSPQVTQTWVGTDGEHIVINTVQGFQKLKNVERDPRVAVSVSDPPKAVRSTSRPSPNAT
jgi:PPOX class probable F420-dependent enzyme